MAGMMHRLFWKIFLSFWVVLVLFTGVIVLAASHYMEQIRAQRSTQVRHEILSRYVVNAQAKADLHGLEGLRAWARKVDREELVPILALTRDGKDVLGRDVPQRALVRLQRHIQQETSPNVDAPGISPVELRGNGGKFWLTHDFQSVTMVRYLTRPRVVALPLAVGLLLGALVCYLLARYLTAPIERLRKAMEAYATGDLDQRVTPSLGSRRDEIVDLAAAFDRMAERLNTVMSSQKQLLVDVSHELRSPLSRLQVALGLARQRNGNEPSPELDRIERESERLNELIGQLLSLARLESGTQPPVPEPVDLSEMLQSVISNAALEAKSRQCSLHLEHTEPVTIQGNAQLIYSAIENVVRNAVRYTAENTAVTLSLMFDSQSGNKAVIRVRDRGPGVPENMLARLFEPFVRVGDARDRGTGGYGLGLAIAERAVRLHGGDISACNLAEGGFAVTISLPA